MDKIKKSLYSARWAITEGIDHNDYNHLDYAADMIAQAKADIITSDVVLEPDRDSSKPITDYEVPTFKYLDDVFLNTQGRYQTPSGTAKGLVVHYTVSGRSPQSAENVLKYLARKGLGCMVMDEDGVIYCAGNQDWSSDVAWHAGKSAWGGVTGLSRYCMGMEICNWGTAVERTGTNDVRVITDKKDNQFAGSYQKYTEAQEKALIGFISHCLATMPDFDIDWLVGHDEIATPHGRKTDPGGSLSMTMPELRAMFK
jgi:N-acetyl-anhydromuramyl-L-alanine amidase AmpD